jgi:peptide/nickel transport system ATP-binding protein
LQRERQLGLLLITHDLAVVSQMAHRVALMYAGQIVEVASAADFFRSPSHPYAQALLKALPQASQRDKVLESIPGSVPPLWLQFEGCRFESRCKHANADCRQVPPALKPLSPGHEVRCLRAPLAPSAAAPHIAASADPVMARHQAPQSSMGPIAGPADPVMARHQAQQFSMDTIADSADPVMARREAPWPSVPPSPLLLQVRDLRVTYTLPSPTPWAPKRHFHAVDGISFSIAPGQTLALVGESGCGKTTTGKAIAQLLRRFAQLQGRITLYPSAASPQAQPVDLLTAQGPDLMQVRRAIQIIFQDPFASLNPRMRVADILEEGVKSLVPDLDPQARRQRIRGLVDRVGLRLDALERYPHEFSGGQRQRIAIARALAVSPQLVICDEPTSALDVSVQAQILNLLRDLQSDMGLSYLFITHNIAVVEVLAHQVAVMRAGVIVEQGPAHAVLSSPQETYTRDLLAAVPRLRTEVPTDPVL